MKYQNYTKDYIFKRLATALLGIDLIRQDQFTIEDLPKDLIQTGEWVRLTTNTVKNPPAGSIVLDVETSDDTKTLAMASCYHLETNEIYYWISPVGKFDELLNIPEGCLVIAHRAAFENSFIRNNYVAGQPNYRSFCTYAYSASVLHSLKPTLYRAMPWLPMFGESSDCSLADLYSQATRRELEKGDVEIFIRSKGDDWRKDDEEIYRENRMYEQYVGSTLINKKLPVHLRKLEMWKYPTQPRSKKEREDKYTAIENIPDENRTHHEKLDLHKLGRMLKLANPYTYEAKPYSEELYYEEVGKILGGVNNKIRKGLLYNIRDTLATAEILPFVLDHIHDILEHSFIGIQIRLQPVYAIDPSFIRQRNTAEETWKTKKEELQKAAERNVRSYILLGGEWDGQDWAEKPKTGIPSWYDEKKIGYTKTLNAIASQIYYRGLPLKRISARKPVKLINGDWAFPESVSSTFELKEPGIEEDFTTRKYWCYEKEALEDLTYEERLGRMNSTNTTPLENPESSDTKAFKSVINFFSKALLNQWITGIFTCAEKDMSDFIHIYMSTSYWTSIRKRMQNLKIVNVSGVDFVCPRPSVYGAVSGRSVDSTFLVLAKLDAHKIGSELCGMFIAPPGYKLVAWDLDSCQARLAGLVADAWYAKRTGAEKVIIGSTGISQAVYFGRKDNRTSLAHKLGDSYLGFDLTNKVEAERSYTLGKNAQFSLIFGVGAEKLAKMLNISVELALTLTTGWKGEKDLQDKSKFIGGLASDLINAQSALAQGYFPVEGNAGVWLQTGQILGVVLGDRLPNILHPRNSQRDFLTTKYNAFIQNGDVAMLNWTLAEIDKKATHIDFRYNSSIHDYFGFFVRENQVDLFKEIAREVHKECYVQLMNRWNVDFESVPEDVWYPSSIDVTQRLVKKPDDELAKNSRTISFEGYSQDIWGDLSIDMEELVDLDNDDD